MDESGVLKKAVARQLLPGLRIVDDLY